MSWTKFTGDNLSKAMQEEQATSSLRSEHRLVQATHNQAGVSGIFDTIVIMCHVICCAVCLLHTHSDAVLCFIRALVEQMLQDTTEDLRVQCSNVDQAFSQRCKELIDAKIQLEMKLAQVDKLTE